MGDVRFEQALARARDARTQPGRLQDLSTEELAEALGALGKHEDPMLANVLATEMLNRARYAATVLETVGEGLVALDGEARVRYVNPEAVRLLGWTVAEMEDRDFHELVHHRHAKGERVARERCALLRALDERSGDVHVNDHDVFERKDGSRFLVGFTASPVVRQGSTTGLVVAFRDISVEKEREERLLLAATALDVVADPVFWVDRAGRILYANVAAAKHLGLARADITSRRVFDVDAGFDARSWDEHWGRVARDGMVRVESEHVLADGRRVPVVIKVTHVDADGEGFHVALVRRAGEPR